MKETFVSWFAWSIGLALSSTNRVESIGLIAPRLSRIQNEKKTGQARNLHHTTNQGPPPGLQTVHTEGDASFAIIINLPQSLGSREAKKLVRELKMQITDELPLVILDLSRVKKMDCAGVDGLLVCMHEVAKHDGAIHVRAISPEAATLLEMVRMDRLLLQKFAAVPAQAPGFVVAAVTSAEDIKPEAVEFRLVAA